MFHYFVLVLVVCSCGSSFGADESPSKQVTVVIEDLGKIVGYLALTSKRQHKYYTFNGIPYANPASYTKDKRFEPSSIWEGKLDPNHPDDPWLANKIGNMCPQRAIVDFFNLTQTKDLFNVIEATAESRRQTMRQLQNARKSENSGSIEAEYKNPWGKEECLTLNINSPVDVFDVPNEKLPVIVYVHGGSGDAMFSSVFMGLRLLERRVLLVTINYRLGALGAFNLGVDGAPGCAAAYDVITALQWIQKYIKYFGGNDKKVTLVGNSAGAMLVTHLMLSPLTKGKNYYNNVVAYSGSALSVWATAEHPSIDHHLKVARVAGCYEGGKEVNKDEIVACMKSRHIRDLVYAMEVYQEDEAFNGRLGYDARVPSIQSETLTIPRLLEKDPLLILQNKEQNNVPLLIGSTKHDGSFALEEIYSKYLEPRRLANNPNYLKHDLLPELLTTLGFDDTTGILHHSFARQYLGEAAYSEDFDSKIPGLIDISTVFAFKAGQQRLIEEHVQVNPNSYLFSFNYNGRWTLYEILQGLNRRIPGGVSHVDDQMYLFYFGPMLNEDARVSERYIDYLVNFAYESNPNGKQEENNDADKTWKKYDRMTQNYFEINKIDKNHLNARDSWINASKELFPVKEVVPDPTEEYPDNTTENHDSGNSSVTTLYFTQFLVILIFVVLIRNW